MKTIWKYSIETTDIQLVVMPKGAQILTVQTQNGLPCLWALVDTNSPNEQRLIRTHGTGHDVFGSQNLQYIGTYQLEGGALIFHVFEELQ